MSDRPTAVNGKRSIDWGTRRQCPACGECLCFGCHPSGPCLDDSRGAAAAGATSAPAVTAPEPLGSPLR